MQGGASSKLFLKKFVVELSLHESCSLSLGLTVLNKVMPSNLSCEGKEVLAELCPACIATYYTCLQAIIVVQVRLSLANSGARTVRRSAREHQTKKTKRSRIFSRTLNRALKLPSIGVDVKPWHAEMLSLAVLHHVPQLRNCHSIFSKLTAALRMRAPACS